MTARFLDNVATRIIELDRGRLASFPGNYHRLPARARTRCSTPKRSRERQVRQVAGAGGSVDPQGHRGAPHAQRRPRAAARAAAAASAPRAATVWARSSSTSPPASARARSSRNCEHVSKRLATSAVISDFSTRDPARRQGRPDRPERLRQDHAAQADPRRRSSPTAGSVRRGTKLQVAYFDQLRAQLDDEATLADTISPGTRLGRDRRRSAST